MKKTITHILLIIFLFHSTPMDQLVKLPVLVAHFIEHQQRDSHISFIAFLSMHYWGKDIKDDDEERDRQLPFRTVDIHSIHCPILPLSKSISVTGGDHLSIPSDYPLIKDNYLPDPATSALFRPPRA